MNHSPCYHCPKSPCKHHDTCKEYQEYRGEINKSYKQRKMTALINDYTCCSVMKTKRRKK